MKINRLDFLRAAKLAGMFASESKYLTERNYLRLISSSNNMTLLAQANQNSEFSVEVSCNGDASIDSLVMPDVLVNALEWLTDDFISVSLRNELIYLSSLNGAATVSIPSWEGHDYPPRIDLKESASRDTLESAELLRMLQQVQPIFRLAPGDPLDGLNIDERGFTAITRFLAALAECPLPSITQSVFLRRANTKQLQALAKAYPDDELRVGVQPNKTTTQPQFVVAGGRFKAVFPVQTDRTETVKLYEALDAMTQRAPVSTLNIEKSNEGDVAQVTATDLSFDVNTKYLQKLLPAYDTFSLVNDSILVLSSVENKAHAFLPAGVSTDGQRD